MLIITHIEKDHAADMKERCQSLAKFNRELQEIIKNGAEKTEALKRARMYEAFLRGINQAMIAEGAMDMTMENELRQLAEKHGTPQVLKAVQECFKDEEFQSAVKGFAGEKKDVDTMH